MAKIPKFTRPTFAEALSVFRLQLAERHLPTDLAWIFDENLCFEKDSAAPAGFRLGFQIQVTPPPADAERIAYEHFCSFEAPVVFYRVGSSGGRSVCLLLCDDWFQFKDDKDGFIRRDDWFMLFHPGTPQELEEITDARRWQQRILRDRPLHDLDFCMTLRAVHEILAHGRALSPYEHYALRFLHAWNRFVGRSE